MDVVLSSIKEYIIPGFVAAVASVIAYYVRCVTNGVVSFLKDRQIEEKIRLVQEEVDRVIEDAIFSVEELTATLKKKGKSLTSQQKLDRAVALVQSRLSAGQDMDRATIEHLIHSTLGRLRE